MPLSVYSACPYYFSSLELDVVGNFPDGPYKQSCCAMQDFRFRCGEKVTADTLTATCNVGHYLYCRTIKNHSDCKANTIQMNGTELVCECGSGEGSSSSGTYTCK